MLPNPILHDSLSGKLFVCVRVKIYYKELAHTDYGGWQVQILQGGLAGWRPLRADAVV